MRTLTIATVLAAVATLAGAQPLGTAFTYQGRLTDGGNPATGSFDLQFVLMDAAAGGSQVGSTLTRDDVVVTNGLFAVTLDFGVQFAGAKRFLVIAVRPGASTGAYTPLAPRQELTPAPNATFSLSTVWTGVAGKPAGFADDVDNDALGALTCPSGQIAKRVGTSWACADANDHDHFSQGWTGSTTTGLTVTNAGGAALRGLSTSTASNSTGIYGEVNATTGFGIHGNATTTATGTFPAGVYGSALHGFGVLGATSDGVGLAGFSTAGTGAGTGVAGTANAPGGTGVYGQANALTGFAIGVRGDTYSPAGIAVWGYSLTTESTGFPIGVEGRSDSPIGIGVNGFAASTTGANYGVRGGSNSSAGTGVIGSVSSTTGSARGVLGESASSAGVGVYGFNSAVGGTGLQGASGATSGTGVGVRAVTNAPAGTGLFASAQGPNPGQNYGVWGETNSSFGTGIHGQAWSTSGAATGVWGRSYGTSGNGVIGQAMSTTGDAWGVLGSSPSTAGIGVYGVSTPTSAASTGVGVWGRGSATGGYGGYFENASGGPAIGLSAGGIRFSDGTTQTTAAAGGDITAVNAGTGLTGGGTSGSVLLGVAFSGSGSSNFVARQDHHHLNQTWTGSQGSAPIFRVNNTAACCGFSDGIWGQSDATGGGRGLVGYASAATGANYGLWAQVDSPEGRGVFGFAPAPSGATYGVYGRSDSSQGTGVAGIATDTTLGPGPLRVGVYGEALSPFGIGVRGYATSTTGAGAGIGVYGQTNGGLGVWGQSMVPGGTGVQGSATGDGTGVSGSNPSITGYAGYFGGRVHVTGTLSKGGGAFKIDHPLDPENKYLYHSFVESPDMMNVYNGNVTTDADGVAVVELPEWFEALNRDFRYQLTVMGQFAQAIVGEKVKDNRFTIRTDRPLVEVSWQVTGIRKDPFAEAHRIPVEEDKPADERGTYLHPAEWGRQESDGLDHKRTPARAAGGSR